MKPSGRNRWQPAAKWPAVGNGSDSQNRAVGCDRLPPKLHGKEGVDGSSPSGGSAKAPHVGAFSFMSTCAEPNVRWVWSRLWSFRADEASRWATMGPSATVERPSRTRC
jgi:hypothetical protein